MIAIRLLSGAVAYSVLMLEVYSGVINGPSWWILPGGLVVALLFAIAMLPGMGGNSESGPGPLQWIVILALSFAMSAGAWYFGHDLVPELLDQRLSDDALDLPSALPPT